MHDADRVVLKVVGIFVFLTVYAIVTIWWFGV